MELVEVIEKMDRLKEELDALRPLREDHLNRLNQKLKLEWNYHSNSIEGNTLTKSETKSFILWGITAKGKPFRDYLEMKGHNDALIKLYQIVNKDLLITESLIKNFHKLILVEPYMSENAEINPGEWKKYSNYLISPTKERIDFAPPEEVPGMMSDLVNWLNNHITPPKRKKKKYDLHPLLIAAGFHVQFIRIHPFGDGNGRMARILTNLILMLCGYVPAIIKQDTRTDYYTAINVSSLNDPENLAIFLGEAVIESLELAIKAGKGEFVQDEDDIDKELELLDRELKSRKSLQEEREQSKKQKLNLEQKKRAENFPHEQMLYILNNSILDFFGKLEKGMSKFAPYFHKTEKDAWLGYEKGRIDLDGRKIEILQNSEFGRILFAIIRMTFSEIRNSSTEFNQKLDIVISFSEKNYTIDDNMIGKRIKLGYHELLSDDEQHEWIRKIQNTLLAQMKSVIDQ